MMASSFKSQNIFGSGPHRFRVLAEGEMVMLNIEASQAQAGSTALGPLELVVEVKGRLISATEGGLWTLRDTIGALLTHPPIVNTLIDHHGRTWQNMSFTRFETEDRTDRGRVRSIGYRAVFMRFL